MNREVLEGSVRGESFSFHEIIKKTEGLSFLVYFFFYFFCKVSSAFCQRHVLFNFLSYKFTGLLDYAEIYMMF